MKALCILLPMLLASPLCACTTEQLYGSAQSWQHNRCSKIPDKAEADRCMSKANTPYAAYKRETEPAPR